jgi:hypothetical protein
MVRVSLLTLLVVVWLTGCGGAADETITVVHYQHEGRNNAIARSVFDYFNAVVAGDGGKACSLLAKREQLALPTVAKAKLGIKTPDCAVALTEFGHRLSSSVIAALSRAALTNTTVDGNTASVEIVGYGKTIHLVRQGNQWLIARDVLLRATRLGHRSQPAI